MKDTIGKQHLSILFICSWYPNKENPTLGNFVQKHAEAAARFNKVSVISVVSSLQVHSMYIEKSTIRGVETYIGYFPKKKGLLGKIFNFLNHRRTFKSVYKTFQHENPKTDLVHLNVTYPMGIWALWLKKRMNLPFVISEHSSGLHVASDHAYPSHVLTLCTKVFDRADFILPVSLNLQDSISKLTNNTAFHVISNVVDETVFYAKTAVQHKHKRFIHISTGVDSIKNISGMLRSVKKLSETRTDFTFLIVSDGDIEYARQLSTQLQLNSWVTFLGTQTTAEISKLLDESDALVQFSNYENFPCVIAEAFMAGKPVISTNVNGIPEHVNERNGILIEKGDEQALCQAMLAILENSITFDAQEIANYAIEYFSYESIGQQFDSIYRNVLSQHDR